MLKVRVTSVKGVLKLSGINSYVRGFMEDDEVIVLKYALSRA